MSVNSYNASYPIEYYDIGTCYSFFYWKPESVLGPGFSGPVNYKEADLSDKKIEKYAKELDKEIKAEGEIQSPALYGDAYKRFIGMVVEKSDRSISVLCHFDDLGYVVIKYAVGGETVYTDNADILLGDFTVEPPKPPKPPKKETPKEPTGPVLDEPTGPVVD